MKSSKLTRRSRRRGTTSLSLCWWIRGQIRRVHGHDYHGLWWNYLSQGLHRGVWGQPNLPPPPCPPQPPSTLTNVSNPTATSPAPTFPPLLLPPLHPPLPSPSPGAAHSYLLGALHQDSTSTTQSRATPGIVWWAELQRPPAEAPCSFTTSPQWTDMMMMTLPMKEVNKVLSPASNLSSRSSIVEITDL